MFPSKKCSAVNIKNKKSKKKLIEKRRRDKLQIFRREATKQRECECEFQCSATNVATLEKMLAKAKKTEAQKARKLNAQSKRTATSYTEYQKTIRKLGKDLARYPLCRTSQDYTPRVPKTLESTMQMVLDNHHTRQGHSASSRALFNIPHGLQSAAIYQATQDSCLLASLVNYCLLVFSTKLKLYLEASMLMQLLTKNCTMTGTGYTIETVIPDFNAFMALEANNVYGTNDRGTVLDVGFELVLRAKTSKNQDIEDFARTKEARNGLFLVYQKISDTVRHALVARGGNDKFYVLDPVPNRPESILVDQVHSVFFLDISGIHTRSAGMKHEDWTEVKSPVPLDVPRHWTRPYAP